MNDQWNHPRFRKPKKESGPLRDIACGAGELSIKAFRAASASERQYWHDRLDLVLRLYLALIKPPYLSLPEHAQGLIWDCKRLADAGEWDLAHCCPDCHGSGDYDHYMERGRHYIVCCSVTYQPSEQLL
jgi:hypothetical protein